jgi:hypothetical protein
MLLPVVLTLLAATPAPAADLSFGQLEAVVEDVGAADGSVFELTDSRGASMVALKVIENATPNAGGDNRYIGVYQSSADGRLTVDVATSEDLVNWTWRAVLAGEATQPYIAGVTGEPGGYVVAVESRAGCASFFPGGPISPTACLRILYYTDLAALLGGLPARDEQFATKLSACSEGTPSLGSASFVNGNLDAPLIYYRAHYSQSCAVDRQAQGAIINWSDNGRTIASATSIDSALTLAGAVGSHRDRDRYKGTRYFLFDGNLEPGAAPSSARVFEYDNDLRSARKLDIVTPGGSTAFADPTLTTLTDPKGKEATLVTLYLPPEAAAPGEAGELLYWHEKDHVVVAAGDIACEHPSYSKNNSDPMATCQHQWVSDLFAGATPLIDPDAVLLLGDDQYECGGYEPFLNEFDPTWGRRKPIMYPAIGNHEYETSGLDCDPTGNAGGYFSYFGAAANSPDEAGCTSGCKGYHYKDISGWRLIALNSGDSAGGTFPDCFPISCSSTSPQVDWLKSALVDAPDCVLAYWHHPRWSSGGAETGAAGNDGVKPFWDVLTDPDGDGTAGPNTADIVLNGHDHNYERFPQLNADGDATPDGIREFVVGTGGRSLHDFGPAILGEFRDTSNTDGTLNRSHYGVLKLTLHPGSYEWSFVDEDGNVRDTPDGPAPCH